jgi:hypothetical protein
MDPRLGSRPHPARHRRITDVQRADPKPIIRRTRIAPYRVNGSPTDAGDYVCSLDPEYRVRARCRSKFCVRRSGPNGKE